MNSGNDRDTRTQDVLACLAVPSRFRLVKAIAEADRCVGELAISVGLSQSCTTRHLQALERAGLVRGRRDGRRVRFVLCAEAGEAESLLGLVLGGPGPPAPGGAAVLPAPDGTHRAKRLSKENIATVASPSGSSGSATGPELPAPPAGEGAVEKQPTARTFRRQDIEDYLL